MLSLGYLRRLFIKNIASPYGLAMVSYAVFLFAWVFPPNVYADFIAEHDHLFLDVKSFVFYTTCVAAFFGGVTSITHFNQRALRSGPRAISVRNEMVYLCVPLVLSSALCTAYLIELGGHMNFIAFLTSQQGDMIKVAHNSGLLATGRWTLSQPLSIAVLCWAAYRRQSLELKAASQGIFRLLFLLGGLVNVAVCVSMVDRASLFPLLIGLITTALYHASSRATRSVSRLAREGMSYGLGLVGAFVSLSLLRGANGTKLVIVAILGYTVASYNRLAALLDGSMTYMYGGTGIYLFQYLQGAPRITSLLRLNETLHWPSYYALWSSEFASVINAGVNPMFIWSGAFGYLYADLGWGALFYLYGAGLLIGYLWIQFVVGRTSGLVLYPYMAFWILFWVGGNLLISSTLVYLFYSTIALSLWDRLCIHKGTIDSVTHSTELVMFTTESARG